MPISSRLRLFCAKVESALGTAETLNAATGVANIIEMGRTNNSKFVQVPAQNSFGQRKGMATSRMGSMNFSLFAHGLGSSGLPYWANWLTGCGGVFAAQVLAPVADNAVGLTCGIYRGLSTAAILQSIKGAMGSAVWNLMAGEPCRIDFSMTGVQVPDATVTLPTVTHPTTTPPNCTANVITIGGTEYIIDSLIFDMGNTVSMRQAAGASGGSAGYLSAWIPNRMPKVRISPEALPLSTKDWEDVFYSNTTVALSAAIGSASNNTITIAAPALQLSAPPGDGDREGIYTRSLEFQCNQNSDTEDSEYSIVFS